MDKGVDKMCLVPIMSFVLKKVGPYWIFLCKRMAMAFEDEILFPSFKEDGEEKLGEEESDPLEDDEPEGDDAKESDDDEDADDDLGIEEETE